MIDAPVAAADPRSRDARPARSHARGAGQRVRPRRDHRGQGRQGSEGPGHQHARRDDRHPPLRHAPPLHRRRLGADVRRRHQEGLRLRQAPPTSGRARPSRTRSASRICTRRSTTRSGFRPTPPTSPRSGRSTSPGTASANRTWHSSPEVRHRHAHHPTRIPPHGRRRAARLAAPAPDSLGMQDKAGSKTPVHGHRRLHLRGRSRLGRAAGRAQAGATRTASSRTRRGTSTCTTPSTRPARAPTRWSSSTRRASSSARGARSSAASRTGCTSARKGRTSSST